MELLLGFIALILLGVASVAFAVDSRPEINDENSWHIV